MCKNQTAEAMPSIPIKIYFSASGVEIKFQTLFICIRGFAPLIPRLSAHKKGGKNSITRFIKVIKKSFAC